MLLLLIAVVWLAIYFFTGATVEEMPGPTAGPPNAMDHWLPDDGFDDVWGQ